MRTENPRNNESKVYWEDICGQDIRTPRSKVKLGIRLNAGSEPIMYIKQGKKTDILTLNEFASALYGTECIVTIEKE